MKRYCVVCNEFFNPGTRITNKSHQVNQQQSHTPNHDISMDTCELCGSLFKKHGLLVAWSGGTHCPTCKPKEIARLHKMHGCSLSSGGYVGVDNNGTFIHRCNCKDCGNYFEKQINDNEDYLGDSRCPVCTGKYIDKMVGDYVKIEFKCPICNRVYKKHSDIPVYSFLQTCENCCVEEESYCEKLSFYKQRENVSVHKKSECNSQITRKRTKRKKHRVVLKRGIKCRRCNK